ncbi:hypothetical protein J7I94_22385 [Streptomyces sp. ISL-12]|nr:hypothetical protein [Streptomyces sp. ISL-12]MBT2413275.1 hypothetical protein [Streptomyces sp. ISL-12]
MTHVTSNGHVAEAAATAPPATTLTLFRVTVRLRPVRTLLTAVHVRPR